MSKQLNLVGYLPRSRDDIYKTINRRRCSTSLHEPTANIQLFKLLARNIISDILQITS
jgi:hypothetical protein